MKKIIVSLWILFTLLIWNCSGSPSTTTKQPTVISGYQIFKKNCIICHGADGKMGLNGAKSIPASTLSLEERIIHISNGKGLMQPYKGILTKAEIEAVAKYTLQLGKEE